jgi:hypothetical protein
VGSPSDGHEIIRWDSSTSGTPLNGSTETQSATNRPVSSLFISNSGDWKVLRMMVVASRQPVNNPCPVGFAFLLSRSGRRRLTLQIQAVVLHKVGCGRSSVRQRYFGNAGDLAVYWSATVSGGTTMTSLLPSSADSRSDNRANGVAVRCLKD